MIWRVAGRQLTRWAVSGAIGSARFAEPSPGVEINLAVLGAGFVLLAAVPLLVVVPAAVRQSRR